MQITRPDDWHVHFRTDELMRTVIHYHSEIFNRCLVMPNTDPPITNASQVNEYKKVIRESSPYQFEPIMSIMLTDESEIQYDLPSYRACKLYPKGVTTNSEHGVTEVRKLGKVFEHMQRSGLVLCIHAEDPEYPILDRERAYLKNIEWITKKFPGLRVVIEHLSTKEAVDFVKESHDNVAATVTAHHLSYTLTDLLSNGLKPHLFCYPILKSYDDLNYLRSTVILNNKGKFFFGSDSAPHLITDKETSCCRAGIFAPAEVTIPLLMEIFNDHWRAFENFISVYGAEFYRVGVNKESFTLLQEEWTVPLNCNGIRPLKAGEKLKWKILTETKDSFMNGS